MTTLSPAQLRVLGEIATATDKGEAVVIPRGNNSKTWTFRALESYGYVRAQGVRYAITERGRGVLRTTAADVR